MSDTDRNKNKDNAKGKGSEKMDGSEKKSGKIIFEVLRYIRKYYAILILSLICAIVSVISTLIIPVLTGKVIDAIAGSGNVDFTAVKLLLKKIAAALSVTFFSQWVMNECNNRLSYNVVRDVRRQAFEKLMDLPIGYFDRHSTGEVVSRIIADADQFSDGLLMGFTQLFTGICTIVGTLIFMLSINVGTAVAVAAITPVSLVVASIIAKSTYSMFTKQAQVRGSQTAYINEMINGIRVVKAFGREESTQAEFDKINKELSDVSKKAIFYSSTVNPSTRFINSLVYTSVALFGSISAIKGSMSVGELSCFLGYASQYTKPFNEISGVVTELQNAFACAGRLFEMINEAGEVNDSENALVLDGSGKAVEARNVSFGYTKDTKVLRDISFTAKPGAHFAIVGPTGCGKTTLINLLMRFYDVSSGEVRIGGDDIRDITRKSLRTSFGMVLQETWLKSATVRDNLRLGNPQATDDEIIEAAKTTHAHSFIKRLSKGYDTFLEDGDGGLSNGQKQLLCITRVILSKPPMLILDEATSSIDTRTEIKIQEAFDLLMKGRTSFVVAHRLSTIKNADVILVMKDGSIIEQGNHEELIKKKGFYEDLYSHANLYTS